MTFRSSIILFVVSTLLTTSVWAAETIISGRVTHVRDIDTFEVEGLPIRLNGVDGPELSEPHGQQAKAWLRKLIEGTNVQCALNGQKTYDRVVGTCYLADGKDIGALIISEGYGRDCPRYSRGKYAEFESSKSKKLKQHKYCKSKQ